MTVIEDIATRRLKKSGLLDNTKRKILLQPADSAACGFYRIFQPGLALFKEQSVLPVATVEILSAHKLFSINPFRIVTQRQLHREQLENLRTIKRTLPDAKLIMDIDDLLWLPSGSKRPRLSQDQLKTYSETLKLADQIVCSTPTLARFVKNTFKLGSVVLPNLISGASYRSPKPRAFDRLRVCWSGGAFHDEDLELLNKVLPATADLIDWIFIGDAPKKAEKYAYRIIRDWVPTQNWLGFLEGLFVDVAVAPLRMNAFNRAKSNIRLLEWNSIGVPVVSSEIDPYLENRGSLIKEGPKEVSQWIEVLRELAVNEELRISLAMDSFVYSAKFNLEGNIPLIKKAWLLPVEKDRLILPSERTLHVPGA